MAVTRDKYNVVWLIFFMLGLGTLLPWNFFMTATMYFTSRLKEAVPDLGPEGHGDRGLNTTAEQADGRSTLKAIFNNVMTLCAMVPLLAFTCLNSFLHSLVPQKVRVMGSLVVILLVFAITAILVKVTISPLPFFTITMIKIVIINCFGAILQGSLFGMAGLLPEGYTTPIMSGQGLAGTFAALAMICAIASGSEMQDAAFGYFITACFVIFLTIMSYVVLPRMEFFQFYQPSKTDKILNETENALDLKDNPTEGIPMENTGKIKVSMLAIFKKIWILALSVCFCFTVTIGTFPAVTADVKSTIARGGAWEGYFIPVSCFLFFNLFDWAGRSFTALCMWPGKDSKLLPLFIVLRCVFVPLFMLCNVQPRSSLPVVFEHDAWFIVFMVLFAFSNGYLASLCMCHGPKQVLRQEAETAGSVMAFFLSLGLALGAAFSFLFRGLV